MEIIEGKEKMLSNYEVLKMLKDVKENTKKSKSHSNKNLATITYETITYLEGLKHYNDLEDVNVINYLEEIKKFNLTKLEKLQILNQRPISMVDLQALIEENEERFSEEAMEMILEIVNRTLPVKEDEVKDEDKVNNDEKMECDKKEEDEK